MKVSFTWLKDYVDPGVSAEKLAERLTLSGMEVKKIETSGKDKVFEIEVTPNRPDCLNMFGLARETSAALNKPMKLPQIKKPRLPQRPADIAVLDKAGCLRYIGIVFSGVKVGPAPQWIRQRLQAAGLRPINNIVDITNFCLLETGQPMHAFDYDKLSGKQVIVRRAAAGEKIITLDGKERTLDASVLVIADSSSPVAVAGIMGAEATQVTEQTQNILLESAYFDPGLVRRAGRLLGLSSDSSYRFERGVDMEMVAGGAWRAASFVRELAGGDIERHKDIFSIKHKAVRMNIIIDPAHVSGFLGVKIKGADCKSILKKLGFTVAGGNGKSGGKLAVMPPSFRQDVKQPVDVIEEISRIAGYDRLPITLPQIKPSMVPEDRGRAFKAAVKTALKEAGLNEIITYTLYNQESLDKTFMGTALNAQKPVRIQNPLTQEQTIMRSELLPSLLANVRLNFNRGEKDVRFFEVGKVYPAEGERDVLGILMTGTKTADWRTLEKQAVDFYDLKGPLARLFQQLRVADISYEPDTEIIFDDACAAIKIDGQKAGIAGRLKAGIIKNWDIRQQEFYYAEVDLKLLCQKVRPKILFHTLPQYPAVVRDVSLAVKNDVMFRQIVDLARDLGGDILSDVNFVEMYLGEKIPAGQRGLVFSLVYRSDKRTLTEEEVNAIHSSILNSLSEKLGAAIR